MCFINIFFFIDKKMIYNNTKHYNNSASQYTNLIYNL